MSVDKLYKCSARYCPGLPFDPRERAHPVTCSETRLLRQEPMVYGREAEWVRVEAEAAQRQLATVQGFVGGRESAKWIPSTRVREATPGRAFGTSGQAEWPPSGDGERSYWPPIGTGPITDADVEAAAACVAGLMPWTVTYGNVSPAEAATLAERVAALMRERDDLRAEVDLLTRERNEARTELNAAHEAGLTPRRPTT